MQLIIEVSESDLVPIAENTIKRLLKNDTYGIQGDAAEYIQRQTKAALMAQLRERDFSEFVRNVVETCCPSIVEEVVHQEIARITRQTVKELKSKGQ